MKTPVKSAQSYRTPMKVTEVLLLENGDAFSICPRCSITLDRDFQRYCDRCGQHLDWCDIDNARIREWREWKARK